MLKHTPKLLVSKATTLPTKLGGSKKRWLLNKIKLTWDKKIVFHCKEWWAASLFILFPGLFEIVAQSADGTAILFLVSWNVCGCCQEMGTLGLFALWGIVSYRKRYQIGCVGVEYRFKRNIYTSILSRAHVSSSPQFACQLCFVHTIPLSGGWTLPWI